MGCDIHAFAEVKRNGKWLTYSALDINRDYRLFAKMANVRNGYDEITPISKPRGLPEDVAEVTKVESDDWDSDGHSHSWLSDAEVQDLLEWIRKNNQDSPFTIELDLPPRFQYLNEYDAWEDRRLVFWFDN